MRARCVPTDAGRRVHQAHLDIHKITARSWSTYPVCSRSFRARAANFQEACASRSQAMQRTPRDWPFESLSLTRALPQATWSDNDDRPTDIFG